MQGHRSKGRGCSLAEPLPHERHASGRPSLHPCLMGPPPSALKHIWQRGCLGGCWGGGVCTAPPHLISPSYEDEVQWWDPSRCPVPCDASSAARQLYPASRCASACHAASQGQSQVRRATHPQNPPPRNHTPFPPLQQPSPSNEHTNQQTEWPRTPPPPKPPHWHGRIPPHAWAAQKVPAETVCRPTRTYFLQPHRFSKAHVGQRQGSGQLGRGHASCECRHHHSTPHPRARPLCTGQKVLGCHAQS